MKANIFFGDQNSSGRGCEDEADGREERICDGKFHYFRRGLSDDRDAVWLEWRKVGECDRQYCRRRRELNSRELVFLGKEARRNLWGLGVKDRDPVVRQFWDEYCGDNLYVQGFCVGGRAHLWRSMHRWDTYEYEVERCDGSCWREAEVPDLLAQRTWFDAPEHGGFPV